MIQLIETSILILIRGKDLIYNIDNNSHVCAIRGTQLIFIIDQVEVWWNWKVHESSFKITSIYELKFV